MSDPLFTPQPGPAGPYPDGTGGHSGSSTSAERAEREATDGTLDDRKAKILTLLGEAGPTGMTVVELRADRYALGHHGAVSGALSNLHREGRVTALKHDRRGGAGVYVLPQHVLSRITRPYNPNKANRDGNQGVRTDRTVLDEQALLYMGGQASVAAEPTPKRKSVLTPAEQRLVVRTLEGRRRAGSVQVATLRMDTLDGLLKIIERLSQ